MLMSGWSFVRALSGSVVRVVRVVLVVARGPRAVKSLGRWPLLFAFACRGSGQTARVGGRGGWTVIDMAS